MKLHLPKGLFVAVVAAMAAVATPASAIVIQRDLNYDSVSTSASFENVNGMTYDAETGLLTGAANGNFYFQLDTRALKAENANQHIVYVTNDTIADKQTTEASWGFNTTDNGLDVTGYWYTSGNNGTWTSRGSVSNSLLTAMDDENNLVTLKTSITGGGTNLYSSSGETTLYNGSGSGGLYTATGNIVSMTVNSDFVENILYNVSVKEDGNTIIANADGSWSNAYKTADVKIIGNGNSNERFQINGGTNTADGTPWHNVAPNLTLVVCDKGQIFLQTFGKGSIVVQNNIVLGKGSDQNGYGALRFGNDGNANYTTTVNGTISVVEDTKICAGGKFGIFINGAVEGAQGKTLTLVGKGYTFNGNVSLGNLTATSGTEAVFNGAFSVGSLTNAGTLTLGAATVGNVTNTGTIKLNGTMTGTAEGAAISGSVNAIVDNITITSYEGVTYSYADGTAASGKSGFITGTTALTIFKGIDYSSATITINGEQVTLENGEYSVDHSSNTGFYIGDAWSYNAEQSAGATAYYLGSKGTLILTEENSSLLTSAQGAGNITLQANASVTGTSATQATGKLTIVGKKLTLGGQQEQTASISSFGTVELQGTESAKGSIEFNNKKGILNNLTVAAGQYGQIHSFDMGAANDGDALSLSGLTTVNGNLAITNRWNTQIAIGTLTGAGEVSVTSGVFEDTKSENEELKLTISDIGVFTGKLNLTSQNSTLTTTINSLAGFTGEVKVEKKNSHASTLTLNNLDGNIGIKSIELAGGALKMSVNSGKTASYANTITGSGALSKTGAGTLTLSGANTYSGGTVIEGGNLCVTNTSALGSGTVTLAGGNLVWNANSATISQVNVTANSDFTIFDQKDSPGSTLTLSSVGISEGKTFSINKNNAGHATAWKHNLNIGVLTGAGSLDVNGPGASGDGESTSSKLSIGSLDGFTGNISVTSRKGGNTKNPTNDAYTATINTGTNGATFNSLTTTGFDDTDNNTFTFNVQGATTVQNINVTSGKAIIDIAEKGTLNAFTKGGDGSITMKGSGIYNLGSSTTLNAELDSTWTGTVKMSGATLSDADLNAYGNAKSTVELSNVSGTLAAGTVATNISLVPGDNAPAFKSTASDGRTVTFAGAISGTGNFVVQADNTSAENYAADTYIFSGDVTGWKKTQGGYDIGFIAASAANVKYEGDATTINAGIYADGGALNATFGGEKAVTMNGDITNKKWQNTGTLNLTVSNSSAEGVTFTNTVKANTTTIAADSKATFTGATADLGTLTLAAGASVTTSGALTLGNISLDLTDYEAGNYTLVSATNGGSISWKKDSWTHNGTLAAGLVANVGFDGADNKTLTLTIAKAETTVTTVVIEEKDGEFWYTLNELGTSLTLNVEEGSLAGLVEGGLVELELISERMKQDILQKAGFTSDEVAVTLYLSDGHRTIEAGKDAIVGFYNEDHEGYWGKQVGSNREYELGRIPEPTTATLSLLALCGLAARRRRRA